jgi:hemerythrin-like domain-containing protein
VPPTCRTIDLRRLPTVEAKAKLSQALSESPGPWLVKSSRAWEDPSGLVVPLVVGPSAFYWVCLAAQPGSATEQQSQLAAEYTHLLQSYGEIIRLAVARDPSAKRLALVYERDLRGHIRRDETVLFPAIDQFLDDNRFTREMNYDHRGILAGLATFEATLDRCLNGTATRKELDKQELDLQHMLEHHLEREEQGVLPLLPWL